MTVDEKTAATAELPGPDVLLLLGRVQGDVREGARQVRGGPGL